MDRHFEGDEQYLRIVDGDDAIRETRGRQQ